jgi:hypothetical protein
MLIHRLIGLEMESQSIEVMILKMHSIQFGLIVNLIQMKSMKVIYNMKNMMNQEFEHCAQSQLIQAISPSFHEESSGQFNS